MPLLERDTLFSQLQSLLDEARGGIGRLVCLLGEAGAGKSALVQTLANSARETMRVLWGACEDLSTAEPLGPLHDLARASDWTLPAAASDSSKQLTLFGEVLQHLAGPPTLVVLEDLHWADDATLDFVRYLGRRMRGMPLMVAVTARNDTLDAQSRVRRAIVGLPSEIYLRVEVPRLSESAVNELSRLHGKDGARIYALTGGNAFLVTEVVRSGLDYPETVRDALLLRAERLAPSAKEALWAASIFPRRVETRLLEAMVGASSIDGIGQCVAAGMLVAEREFYSFRHEIARGAVEMSLPPSTRVRLNQRALELLLALAPTATARLMHHAIEAQDVEAVRTWAPHAAAEAARVGAHRQAAKHYEAALRFADAMAPAEHAELLERTAFELQLIGRALDAIEAHQKALKLRERCGDPLAVGDNLRWLSHLSYNAGDSAGADRYGNAAIARLEPLGPSVELARAYANFALIRSLRDDSDSAAGWANKAIELASNVGRDDILADALSTLGLTRQWTDHAAARNDFERGLELALQQNKEGVAARIYVNAACIEINARNGEHAHRLLEEGLAYCGERDLDTYADYMSGWLAELLVREGRWSEAESIARRVFEAPSVTLVLGFPAVAALARLRIRKQSGDLSDLRSRLTFETEPQRMLIYAPILGERAWLYEVDREHAVDLLARAAPLADAIQNTWAAGEIAFWRSRLGDQSPLPRRMAPPFKLQFEGDWQGAAAAWAALPAPYEQALALLGGDEQARARGLGTLDQLGAIATATRARKELRQRGLRRVTRGPRPSTRANLAGLTRRQMDVLSLIDEGLANAEIAARLGLSAKTVDHHVSAILEKLGASTRGEAAARARRAGLIRPDHS